MDYSHGKGDEVFRKKSNMRVGGSSNIFQGNRLQMSFSQERQWVIQGMDAQKEWWDLLFYQVCVYSDVNGDSHSVWSRVWVVGYQNNIFAWWAERKDIHEATWKVHSERIKK